MTGTGARSAQSGIQVWNGTAPAFAKAAAAMHRYAVHAAAPERGSGEAGRTPAPA